MRVRMSVLDIVRVRMSVLDIVMGIFMIFLSIFCMVSLRGFPMKIGNEPGPSYFPFLILCAQILFAIVLVGLAIYLLKVKVSDEKVEIRNLKLAIIVTVTGVCYIYVTPIIGFFISTPLFLTSMFLLLMGELKKWLTALFVSIATTVIFYFIFYYFLQVDLPMGLLPWG